MVAILYGSGLPVSEMCRLRTGDIDSMRMRLLIAQGKAGQRYARLTPAGLRVLRCDGVARDLKPPWGRLLSILLALVLWLAGEDRRGSDSRVEPNSRRGGAGPRPRQCSRGKACSAAEASAAPPPRESLPDAVACPSQKRRRTRCGAAIAHERTSGQGRTHGRKTHAATRAQQSLTPDALLRQSPPPARRSHAARRRYR